MRVLEYLAARPGEVVTRETLLNQVWGDVVVNEDALTRAISELRKLLKDDPKSPRYIATIWKTGYRLIAPVSPGPQTPLPPTATPFRDSDTETASPPLGSRSARTYGSVVYLLLAVLLVGVFLKSSVFSDDVPSLHVATPFTSYTGFQRDPDFSPSGQKVAFSWAGEGTHPGSHIYVKSLHTEALKRLTDLPGYAYHPAWSPDGNTLAFIVTEDRRTAIYTASAEGQNLRKRLETRSPVWGLDWSPDGNHLVLAEQIDTSSAFVLSLLSLAELEKTALTTAETPLQRDHSPAFAPNEHALAFIRTTAPHVSDLYLIPTRGGAPRRLTHLRKHISGLDWTPDGQHVLFITDYRGLARLWRVTVRDGHVIEVPTTGRHMTDLSVAHAASRLIFGEMVFESNIWRLPLAQDTAALPPAERFIHSTQWDGEPTYAPDGRRIAFISTRSGYEELWVTDSAGASPLQVTRREGDSVSRPAWSPDSRYLAFTATYEGTGALYLIPAEGGQERRLTDRSWNTLAASWSHDGRSIYFASDRSGSWQIWKTPVNGGAAVQMTTTGGFMAYESPDGKHLYYTKPNDTGIWQKPIAGTTEHCIVEGFKNTISGNWVVHQQGLYFVKHTRKGPMLSLYTFATQTTRPVVRVPDIADQALSVSSDGQTVLFTRRHYSGSNLMLVDKID